MFFIFKKVVRFDFGRVGWDYGGAWRSARRIAGACGAADPETPDPRGAGSGQPGDRCDSDAGIDDRIAGADTGRSVGRGNGDL